MLLNWARATLRGDASLNIYFPRNHQSVQQSNSLNSRMLSATIRDFRDEDDEVLRDDDGEPLMMASDFISFNGGVIEEHIERHISLWIEDVVERYGLDESILEQSQIEGLVGDELKEMGTAEQIRWALETGSLPRSARQLASFLLQEKTEVNSVLFRRSDLFCPSKAQPPRWNLLMPSE